MLAAIDIGSNTVQLLLAKTEAGRITKRYNWVRTTRLGGGMDGLLSETAIAATAAAISEYMTMIHEADVSRVRIVATSAVRDAANAEALRIAIREAAPDAPEIIVLTGEEEAKISYAGALASLNVCAKLPVIDLGGASGELIWHENGHVQGLSCDIGAVRAQKNGWNREFIYNFIQRNYPVMNLGETVIGVGGTITTAAGISLGLQTFDRDAIEGTFLVRDDLDFLLQTLLPLSIEERRRFSPLLERRGEIMVEGLTIWLAFMDILGFHRVQVTGGGILDGVILQMLE